MEERENLFRNIARLSVLYRWTEQQIADNYGVSRQTIRNWKKNPAFADAKKQFEEEVVDEQKDRLKALMADVVDNLVRLMHGSKSDLVQLQAAQTLGKYIGMEDMMKEKPAEENDEDEAMRLLIQNNQPKQLVVLMPPGGGGKLPEPVGDILEAEFQEIQYEENQDSKSSS